MTESLYFIFKRRSIRRYNDQPVSVEDIDQLLKAAMAAPTAMNAQPWEFVVITEPAVIHKIANTLMFGKHNPTAVIAVCGSMKVAKNPASSRFWVQDCSAALENILLAATALGLGSVWVGIYPIALYVKQVSQILNLPKTVTPLGLVYLGHPDEEKVARTQYDAAKVHWQVYGERKRRSLLGFPGMRTIPKQYPVSEASQGVPEYMEEKKES